MTMQKTAKFIGLSDALASGELNSFIKQEEARGVGPVASKKFDRLAEAVIKSPQSEDQTSRSRGGGGST